MKTQSHIIVWTAGASARLAVCVAAALMFGGCTSNGSALLQPSDAGGTRPTPLQFSILGNVRTETAEGEAPVEGAVVLISRSSGAVTATTDAEGRYVIGDLAIGRWTVAVQKDGYQQVSAEVDLTDTTSVDFVLPVDPEAQTAESGDSESGEPGFESGDPACVAKLRSARDLPSCQ